MGGIYRCINFSKNPQIEIWVENLNFELLLDFVRKTPKVAYSLREKSLFGGYPPVARITRERDWFKFFSSDLRFLNFQLQIRRSR